MHSLALKSGWPPLPLAVRVILVGTSGAYNALVQNTEDFARLFRYEIWCNWDVAWSRETESAYAALADGVAVRYSLPKLDPTGVGRLVEEAARRSEGLNRTRLSTNLLLLHDLVVEAARAAQARGAALASGADVDAILARRRALQTVPAQRVREAIISGEELTPTDGMAIGQINGLGIYEVHPDEGVFAVPMRLSATVSVGREEQLLDIEREADQADADHVRGLMTMEGYLASRYGQTVPISAVARIRFEQEHGATGGDSASAAELFALLSALAHVPLRCSLAVTGAVGQYGEIQPIGGVNTKIVGFWEICRARRALGEMPEGGHGVLIPTVNARDLMLPPEVARSIAAEGWFHIWPISTVDEGLPLLTGLPAAVIHERVQQRLKRFHELVTRQGTAG
jgi:predicted ATP-dependent protease